MVIAPFDRCHEFETIQFSSRGVAHAGEHNCLYGTTDSGRHWNELHCVSADRALGLAPPRIDGLQFVTSKEAWMIADGLLHSGDGGASWSRVEFTSMVVRSVRFNDASVGYWVGEELAHDSSPGRGVVYRTLDGGRTWTEAPLGVSLPYGWRLRDVWPISAADVWAVGDVLVHSTDGGASWNQVNVDRQWQDIAIRFASPQVGWIGRKPENNYLLTVDGGRTWAARQLPFEHIQYDGLLFMNAMEAWAAWKGVFRSMDGGATWTAVLDGHRTGEGEPSYYDVQYLRAEGLVVATSGCEMAFFSD